MPHINILRKSTFLKREDVGRGVLATIRSCEEVNVAKEGAPPEMKWALHFDELDKPMVLNSTNGQIIGAIAKSDITEDWPGVKVVLYDDPNVSFAGKLVGGIRVRAPKPGSVPATATQAIHRQAPPPVEDDSVPF